MTDKKDKETPVKQASDTARKIWLAGVGAYGKAFEEGRERVKEFGSNFSGSTSDAFESLAEKGEKIEMAAKAKGAELAGKASGIGSELRSDLAIEDRIAAMRERLSGGGSDERHDAIEARLASIEAKLDKLLKAQTPAKKTPAKKAPAKRAATKKTTTARTKKAPAKKTAAKKPTAKK